MKSAAIHFVQNNEVRKGDWTDVSPKSTLVETYEQEHAAEEAKALEILGPRPDTSLPRIVGLLATKDIKRRQSWVGRNAHFSP
jgi:hypothetical protein